MGDSGDTHADQGGDHNEFWHRKIMGYQDLWALDTGEAIEQYPDDLPYPNRLVLGWRGTRPLHVVVAENARGNVTIAITAYEPDPGQWNADFKRRKP